LSASHETSAHPVRNGSNSIVVLLQPGRGAEKIGQLLAK
jgi:hypothetical protein